MNLCMHLSYLAVSVVSWVTEGHLASKSPASAVLDGYLLCTWPHLE